MEETKKIIVYTDASVVGDNCGWAYTLKYADKGNDNGKTSMQMEMYAVLNAMKAIKDKTIPTEIHTDCEMIVKIMRGEYKVTENIDLWNELFAEKNLFTQGVLTFTHVRVDEKNPNLQEVDELAYSEAK